MSIFNHPNIVTFFDSWEDYNSINHLLEYIEGDDLYDFIMNNGPFEENKAVSLIKKLTLAVQIVHS